MKLEGKVEAIESKDSLAKGKACAYPLHNGTESPFRLSFLLAIPTMRIEESRPYGL
jgi:hypothetical protein